MTKPVRTIEEAKAAHEKNGWKFPEEFPLDSDHLKGRLYSSAKRLVYESTPEDAFGFSAGPVAFSQFLMAWKLGRKLKSAENIRFVGKSRRDLRFSNIRLKSRTATAEELWRVNGGDPVLGYSHCICKCGERLDIEAQKDRPHAYFPGHSPNDKIREKTQTAATAFSRDSDKIVKASRPRIPRSRAKKAALDGLMDALTTPAPTTISPDSLERFRPLFEDMIRGLSWPDFERILERLLEIKSHATAT